MAELLTRTPDPLPNESILGYVLRVAERNGYDSPWHVFRLAGYKQGQMRTAGLRVEGLAQILGKDPVLLARHAYVGIGVDGKPLYQVSGVPVARSQLLSPLRLMRPHVCVDCIEEHHATDACWELSAFVACPAHGHMLLKECPSCKRPLSWYRPGLLTCACGASLRNAQTEIAPPALLGLMAVLQRKVRGQSKPLDVELQAGMPVEDLENLDLRTLLHVYAVLERLNTTALHTTVPIPAAAEVFGNWPIGFHGYLHRMGSRAIEVASPGVGLIRQFSALYNALFKSRRTFQSVDFLREEFIQFGLKAWDAGVVDEKLLRGKHSSARFVTVSAIARRLGVMPITARRWLANGGLPGKAIRNGSTCRFVADTDGLTALPGYRSDRVDSRDAGRVASLPVSVLLSLKKAGAYSVNPITNTRAGFWRVDLEALGLRLKEMSAGLEVTSAEAIDGSSLVTLQRILQHWKLGGKDAKGALVANLLNGKILPVACLGRDPLQVVLKISDVEAFRVRHAASSGKATLSAAAAAVLLNYPLHAVHALARAGFLARSRDCQHRFTRESVEAIRSAWVPLSIMAAKASTSSLALRLQAEELGMNVLRLPFARGSQSVPFVNPSDLKLLKDSVGLSE